MNNRSIFGVMLVYAALASMPGIQEPFTIQRRTPEPLPPPHDPVVDQFYLQRAAERRARREQKKLEQARRTTVGKKL